VLYSLSTNIDPPNSGNIIPNNGTYEAGSTETLTAQPNPGYMFDRWGGDASGTGNSVSVSMDSNKSITAYFTSIPTPALNVTINYIGVKYAHGGNVQLVVVVSDGETIDKRPIPLGENTFSMSDFDVKTINQRVFHTSSVKDNLKVNILAYHRDQSKKDYLDMIQMMEWYYGDGITMLKNLILNMPENDKLIGYYDNTWYPDEDWGIGQYNEVGIEDLRVWFSIWSDSEPAAIPKPSLLPDVRIKSVSIPSETKQSAWVNNTSHVLTLVNNEEHKIPVNWNAYSSITGNFDSGRATVPGNGHINIKKMYRYDQKPGPVEIRYTILYKGTELDTWSGTLTVIP